MLPRRLGYKRDLYDARDRPLDMLLGAASRSPPPPSFDLSRPEVGPRDQGDTNSCTGQAWSQALRLAWLTAGAECPELSALFAYYVGRAETGEHTTDGGSYLRTLGKAIMRFGCAEEHTWPFSDNTVNLGPPHDAYRSAFDRKGPRGYYRIPAGNADEVRRALAAGHPVVGGWAVSNAFLSWNGNGSVGEQLKDIAGGHAMCITRYDSDGTFRLLNSWGTSWGRRGYAVVDEQFVAAGSDLWAVHVSIKAVS